MIDILSPEEEERFRRGLEELLIRDRILLQLLLETGIRVGECAKLTINDIAFGKATKSVLHIPPHISKSKSARDLPLSEPLRGIIQIYLEKRYPTETIYPPDHPLFPSRKKGKGISIRQIQKSLEIYSAKVLGRRIHPHTLRHTFATRLLKVSNLRIVQEALGHRRIATTEVYTHPTRIQVQDAIKRCNGAGILHYVNESLFKDE